MKKIIFTTIVGTAMFVFFTGTKMSDDGKAGYTGSPGEYDCTACHTSFAVNSGGGSITLTSTNMTNWMYDPGVTYNMVATVSRSQDSLFGICVEALSSSNGNGGTLQISNSTETQIKSKTVNGVSRRSVVHKLGAGQSQGGFSFEFNWVAPATNIGNVTFYFAGNASDASGDTLGDHIYKGSQVVVFNPNNGISELQNSNDISVYPMPVLDQFIMNYELNSTGIVNINLYSMKGELVSKLSSKVLAPGKHTDNFYLPETLSAGNYILSIETSSGINSRKIMIN